MTGLLLLRRGLPTIDYRISQNAEFLGVVDFIIVSMIGATLAVLVCTARSNHHGVAAYCECASAGYRIAKLSGPNKNSGSSIERSNKLQTFNLIL